jgi:hypothetical protein
MQFEVEQALNLDSAWRVIPVLAEAKMPAAKDLPTSIAQITTVQSAKLSRKTNEWGPGVRALHEEIDNGSVRPLPFYAKPGKRLVRLEHHKYPPWPRPVRPAKRSIMFSARYLMLPGRDDYRAGCAYGHAVAWRLQGELGLFGYRAGRGAEGRGPEGGCGGGLGFGGIDQRGIDAAAVHTAHGTASQDGPGINLMPSHSQQHLVSF